MQSIGLTPEQRSMRARLAAFTRWSKVRDTAAELAPAREGMLGRFEREIDPLNELPADERRRRAEAARRAHMTRLALLSSKARARRAAA